MSKTLFKKADMENQDLLRARRPLIAHVIRNGFSMLPTDEQAAKPSSAVAVPE